MTNRKKRARTAPISLLVLRTREIGAAEFKFRCLELMDEVERSGCQLIITKHRRAVARLIPAQSQSGKFCGSLKSMVLKHGDLVAPTGVSWKADEPNLT